jgi:hypothetical protein
LLPQDRDLDGGVTMAQPSLVDLTAAATAADEPSFITASDTKFGGVDPLGLRQINFDLMDEVFPGLNNVARHIRPFIVVAWAWRRASERARELGMNVIKQGQLQDFVDRIEVLYVLSQVLRDKNADLPGGQYLAPWLQESEFKFGGPKWQQRREARRYSTALSAPINYGPGLKMLGWVTPHPQHPAVMIPNPAVAPALDAFEAQIARILDHEAFSAFGPVTVSRDEARAWAELWSLDIVTKDEARVMSELFLGSLAPVGRRLGGQLMLSAAAHADSTNTGRLRAAMAGSPSDFTPPAHLLEIRDAWRRVQIRQLFRLCLEALFYWTVIHLDGPSRSIDSLVSGFLDQLPLPVGTMKAGGWIESLSSPAAGPTELIMRIEQALEDPAAGDLARSIAAGLGLSLLEVPQRDSHPEQPERLPLSRARKEAAARSGGTVHEFVRHILESWVLAQHAYWSVGRGLADARTRGKMLLRLRIILDEGGWTLTPGAPRGSAPRPTPDRLQTAITLANECGLFNQPPSAS